MYSADPATALVPVSEVSAALVASVSFEPSAIRGSLSVTTTWLPSRLGSIASPAGALPSTAKLAAALTALGNTAPENARSIVILWCSTSMSVGDQPSSLNGGVLNE